MLDKILNLIPVIVDSINASRVESLKSAHDQEYTEDILMTLRRVWPGLTEKEQRFVGAAILSIAKTGGKPIFAGSLWQYLGIDKLPSVKGLTKVERPAVRQSPGYKKVIESRNDVMRKLRGVLYTTKGGLLHVGASSGSTLDVDALLAELCGPTTGKVKASHAK